MWENLVGQSLAIEINSSISAIFPMRLSHSGMVGTCVVPQCIGMHSLAAFSRGGISVLQYR